MVKLVIKTTGDKFFNKYPMTVAKTINRFLPDCNCCFFPVKPYKQKRFCEYCGEEYKQRLTTKIILNNHPFYQWDDFKLKEFDMRNSKDFQYWILDYMKANNPAFFKGYKVTPRWVNYGLSYRSKEYTGEIEISLYIGEKISMSDLEKKHTEFVADFSDLGEILIM